MDSSLQKIIDWAKIHASQTLEYLNAPANDGDIKAVETEIGVELPEAFKALLKKFDGETGPWLALLGDGNQLLSCKQIIEQYKLEQELAKQIYDPEMDTIEFWQDRVSGGIIFVKGAVKPLMQHPKWVPVTIMNGDVFRYLDYAPAPGGTSGQVIEVDPESCSYQVLANSFEAFLARYAQQLEAGLFKVDDEGYIESIAQDDMNWGIPAWLRTPDAEPLKASAKKVQDYLVAKGCDFIVKELPGSTRTAQEAAQSIGCTVSQIAKSIVFREQKSNKPVLVIASGSNRICNAKIERVTGLKLAKADASYIKAELGYAIGGVPPVAHAKEVSIILDPDLKAHEVIWAAAGTPNAVFALKPEDLEMLTGGQWVELSDS